jgi:hypothetical protein
MQGNHHHPWRELRALSHIRVDFARLAPGVWGLTNGHHIWIHSGLMQAERRCTLAHELEHVRRGHRGCQPESVEVEVHQAVARRLIPFDALLDACRWAHNLEELADELWVDEPTARVRLEHLHPSERIKLKEVFDDRH